MAQYLDYYDSQVGGGIEHVFVGAPYQKGHGGIGRFLGGLFRKALPFLKRGARAVGKEALRAGMNILDDISTHKVAFKEALRNRTRESGNNLKRKAEEKLDSFMEGSGYNQRTKRRKAQSSAGHRKKRIASSSKTKHKKRRKTSRKTIRKKSRKNKNKRTARDIFGPI